MKINIFLLFCILAISFGCKQGDPENPLVARVFDKELYASELKELMPTRVDAADSARIAQQIIDSWIKNKAILAQAEANLTDEQKNFNKQLEEYRNSLIIYAYESELINQKLDTAVSDEEIENYYNNNLDNFQLKGYIVKVKYIKLPEGVPELENIEELFDSEDEQDLAELYEYCTSWAANFFLEDDVWLYLDDILKEVPFSVVDNEEFVKNKQLMHLEKDQFIYYLKITDYKLKDDISPLSLEVNVIKNLIVNKRKVDLIANMRNTVLQEALNNNEVENF